MTSEDFIPLLALAKSAMGNGPNKWRDHALLMTWFRADNAKAVIKALQAAARVCECPGGINNQAMHKTIALLKPIQVEPE